VANVVWSCHVPLLLIDAPPPVRMRPALPPVVFVHVTVPAFASVRPVARSLKPLPLNASCWVFDAGTPTLYLRLRGAVAAVEAACRSLGGERQDNAAVAPDWSLCRDQQLPWFAELGERDLWRLSVPQTAPVLDLPEAPLIEWHGAQRWVRAEPGAAPRLREVAAEAGGHATLFRRGGAQGGSGVPAFDAPKPPLDRIHHALKRQFDPAGIFNPGRLFAAF
jgi:glycolate oxidase FAD binding subunit